MQQVSHCILLLIYLSPREQRKLVLTETRHDPFRLKAVCKELLLSAVRRPVFHARCDVYKGSKSFEQFFKTNNGNHVPDNCEQFIFSSCFTQMQTHTCCPFAISLSQRRTDKGRSTAIVVIVEHVLRNLSGNPNGHQKHHNFGKMKIFAHNKPI